MDPNRPGSVSEPRQMLSTGVKQIDSDSDAAYFSSHLDLGQTLTRPLRKHCCSEAFVRGGFTCLLLQGSYGSVWFGLYYRVRVNPNQIFSISDRLFLFLNGENLTVIFTD